MEILIIMVHDALKNKSTDGQVSGHNSNDRKVMRKSIIFPGLFIILLTISILIDTQFSRQQTTAIDQSAFLEKLSDKQDLVNEWTANISKQVTRQGLNSLDNTFFNRYIDGFKAHGIGLYIFNHNNQLLYWNTNSIPVKELDTVGSNEIKKLGNGWYYTHREQKDSFSVTGLVLIKKKYPYENQYMQNGFEKYFDLPANISILKDPHKGLAIRDHNGEYLLSLQPARYDKKNLELNYLSLGLFLTAFIFLFLFIDLRFRKIKYFGMKTIFLLSTLIFLGLVRFLNMHYQFPDYLYQLSIFDPSFYASSAVIPNLGDLLLHLICLWFIVWLAARHMRNIAGHLRHSKYARQIFAVLFILVQAAFIIFLLFILHTLIFNSSFSFEFHRFFQLDLSGLFMLLTIYILFFIYYLWIDFFIHQARQCITLKRFVWLFLGLSLIIVGLFYHFGHPPNWFSVLFFLLSNGMVILIQYLNASYNYPRLIAIMLVTVVFSMFFMHHYTAIKERDKRKILVTNLESERDRVGELLLRNRGDQVANDPQIDRWMIRHLEHEIKILEYLRNEYFDGYFNKYDFQISVCSPDDDLSVEYESRTEMHHCYSFFEKMIQKEGIPIKNSKFYYLDNLNGRISYIGIFKYRHKDSHKKSTLYISLDSKLTSGQLGYPELLLTDELNDPDPLNAYSYAKYKSGELIRRSGDFSFPLNITKPYKTQRGYVFKAYQNYSHLIYKMGNDSVIIISKPLKGFLDILAQFSYVFAFFYLVTLLFVFISGFPDNITRFNYNFKNKITLSMVLVLILSLIAVGTGTVYYTTQQFRQQQKENISEKMKSLIVQLEEQLGSENTLSTRYADYYNQLLTRFSNAFYVDMNLYDLEGALLSTSRPQIFEQKLIGSHMQPEAYTKLAHDKLPQFIHNEKIGSMEYHSAYVPLYNNFNRKLAYLNIPYFTRQKALQKEIYTVIMVMVNIYVFLIILGTIVSVLISNTITKPLRLIRQKIGGIGLDKPNEKIDYESHDEIGELVSEYNRMVEELEVNAEKLAQSEREMAWREMAKQIAHEIKNPLTPMKLKVQYLKRAWDDQVNNFDVRIKHFAASMIQQINALSDIASAFSNFAKMPKARNSKLDLRHQVEAAARLFEHTENIDFQMKVSAKEPVYVFADRDQLSSVFSNLIKNAIQAIPQERKGLIRIEITKNADHAIVKVTDNGNGIPEEMKNKLFRPSFTTKSGGMGMGLAICKKIIEDLGGTISYETKPQKGARFIVEMPLFRD